MKPTGIAWFLFPVLLLATQADAETAENLLDNPSFEQPTDEPTQVPHWELNLNAGRNEPVTSAEFAAVVRDPATARTGEHYVRLANSHGKRVDLSPSKKDVQLKPGLYEYSLWVRGREGTRLTFGNWAIGVGGVDARIERDQWTKLVHRWYYRGGTIPSQHWPFTIMLHKVGEHGQINEPLLLVDDVAVREITCGLADPFSSHMVLQRDKPLPVWGWAKAPGQAITLKFHNQTRSTKADEQGRWQVTLDPMPAGGPYEIELCGTVVAADVMLGDVWICAGQSNMEFGVDKLNGIFGTAPEVTSKADHPQLRLWHSSQQVSLEPLRDYRLRQGKWQSTWMPCTPTTIKHGIWGGFSAAGYFFGREIQADQNIAIGLMQVAHGGTSIEAWSSADLLATIPAEQHVVKPLAAAAQSDPSFVALPKLPDGYAPASEAYNAMLVHHGPSWNYAQGNAPGKAFNHGSACFNGLLSPVFPFAVKGVLWYQGEHNGGDPHYRAKLTALVSDWRSRLRDAELPFIIVQLCNWKSDNKFHLVREAQLEVAQNVPHTALVVTIDLADREGDGYGHAEIHPKNKQDVGHRMALAAKAIAYGESLTYSGPLYRAMQIEGDSIRLSFDHVGAGLVARGGKLLGFTIAGADGKFVPADATLDGDSVLVRSADVPQPVAVEYGYQGYVTPLGTLANQAGLPASPFRTRGEAGE